MAKKRKNPFEDDGFPGIDEGPRGGATPGFPGIDVNDLKSLISGMTDQEGASLFSMISYLAETGVTPEKYTLFYHAYEKIRPMFGHMGAMDMGRRMKSRASAERKPTVKNKTLLLKIQMKGVTKPPMWREVEVPSDMTFLNLHHTIQDLTGLENYHMWQFNKIAYMEDVVIGLPMMDDDDYYDTGLEFVTDDASETPISAYLADEGDKLEYVYDFGDDWIFTVTVKKVIDRKSEHPVCTAFKSALNAMEDSGGPWAYMEARQALDGWDKMTKKEREQFAEDQGFDSADDYHEYVEDSLFDMDEINELLSTL